MVDEIRRRGVVTFAEFMSLALYHPRWGYYTRPRAGAGPVGEGGDFVTAPTTVPLFAATLASMLQGLAGRLGQPLTFVELAAGEGALLRALARYLGAGPGAVVGRWVAVEIAAWARRRLRRLAGDLEVVRRLADAPRLIGPVVLFASELYDALPAHRVVAEAREGVIWLKEYYVAADETAPQLCLRLGEPSSPALGEYLANHAVALEDGQVAELRPQVRALHAGHLRWCGEDALALIIDYGYSAHRLYNARARRGGTLAGYRRHELVTEVLDQPGSTDITAHVNFDDLARAGGDVGWENEQLEPLGKFLALHGALDFLPTAKGRAGPLSAGEWVDLAAAKRFLSPAGMGSDLKVLAQGKGRAWAAYRQLVTRPPVEA